jgi:hypothetical protein
MGPCLRRDDGDDDAASRVIHAIRAAVISAASFLDSHVKQPRQIVPAPPREVSFWFSPL